MEMENQMENEQVQPSYWNSVLIGSLVAAIIATVLGLVGGYLTLGSEPSGSIFSPVMIWGTIGCLVGAVGAVVATWHYAKEFNITFKIGKGALIGLLVALGATIISVIFNQIWSFLIDPSFTEALMDWNIQNTEAMQMPAEAREQAIEGIPDPSSLQGILYGALSTFVGLAIVNVISGMIGAKVFASEE